MDSSSDWDVRSLPSDFSISLPSSPGPSGSPQLPESQGSSLYSLSPRSATHILLPPYNDDISHERAMDTSRTLVLPSLPWPHIPTHYGETLGELNILLVSRRGAMEQRNILRSTLLEDNQDVLRVYDAELGDDGKRTMWADTALRCEGSTEGARNVCLVEMPGYDERGQADEALRDILSTVYAPFRSLKPLLNPDQASSPLLSDLLASSGTHFFTACIFVMSPDMTPLELTLFRALEATLPVLPVRTSSLPYDTASSPLLQLRSAYTSQDVVHALFRSSHAREKLRREAAAGFLSWWAADQEAVHVPVPDTESVGLGLGPSKKALDDEQSRFERLSPMPTLDPLHFSQLASPLSLLYPLAHRMMRGIISWASQACRNRRLDGSGFWNTQTSHADRRSHRHRKSARTTESLWMWRELAQGVAGLAVITALWAGFLWANNAWDLDM